MNVFPPFKKVLGIVIISIFPILGFSQNISVLQNLAKQVQSGQISQQEAIKKAKAAGVDISDYSQLQQQTSGSRPAKVSEEDKAAAPSAKQPRDTVYRSQVEKAKDTVKRKYFGYELFQGPKGKFDQVDIGSIDPGYQVGPGDEIIISIWGQTEMRLKMEVARDGSVFIERYGQMIVSGLTLQQLEQKLTKNLAKIYSGLNPSRGKPTTFLDVSLGELQSIQVFIAGKVENPGSHFVSSYSTAFSALYKSGGPTIKGSLRDIRIIRDGEVVSHLDLYNFITSGIKPNDVRLQNNDVVFVPPRQNTIRLKGEVKQVAFYEMKEDENLKDLIRFSGGLKTSADAQKVQIERIVSFSERDKQAEMYKVLSPDLGKYQAGEFKINPIPLQDKDIVRVMPLTAKNYKDTIPGGVNFVNVHGHVYKPGKYVLTEKMTVKDLLAKAGGLKDSVFWGETHQVRADLIRYEKDYRDRKVIPVHLNKLLNGNDKYNRPLARKDSLIVYNAAVVHEKKEVTVYGEVKNTGIYTLATNMSLQDLLLQAGGFTKRAYKYSVEVFRKNDGQQKEEYTSLHKVDITPDILKRFDKEDDLQLKDYDLVIVRKDPDFEPHKIVRIGGEVKFPGKYPILNRNETLSQLINRAGGLSKEAFLPGLRYMRDDTIRIVGEFDEILEEDDIGVVLQENDSIFVPQHPSTVRVSGNVRRPGLVQYNENWGLGRYIEAAGGYDMKAKKSKTVVYYPGGDAQKKNFLIRPEVKEGSEIYVPQKEEREPVDVTQLLTNWASIATSVATVIYIVQRSN